jgi:hypothetical protein
MKASAAVATPGTTTCQLLPTISTNLRSNFHPDPWLHWTNRERTRLTGDGFDADESHEGASA